VTICNQFRIRRAEHTTTSSTRSFHLPYAIWLAMPRIW